MVGSFDAILNRKQGIEKKGCLPLALFQAALFKFLTSKHTFRMKNKGLLLLLGYLLFSLGITSVIMAMVGTHWYFLGWLELLDRLLSFIIKILMVIAGVLIIVFARTDWEREKRESSE